MKTEKIEFLLIINLIFSSISNICYGLVNMSSMFQNILYIQSKRQINCDIISYHTYNVCLALVMKLHNLLCYNSLC